MADKERCEFSNFISKHNGTLIIIFLTLMFGWDVSTSVIGTINPKLTNISTTVVETLVGDIIDARISPIELTLNRIEQKLSYDNDYAVLLLVLEMSVMRSTEMVDARIDLWEDQTWYAQLAALRYVARNREAVAALRKSIPSDEIYLALMTRVMRY